MRLATVLLAATITLTAGAQTMHHAAGTFTVDVNPLAPISSTGIARFTINKQIHGDLEATTVGEMFAGGDFKTGHAGYVAIEEVTGKLAGKSGTFVLQHFATMEGGAPRMQVQITPGSGTGELKGISGTFTIIIEGGKHSYTLDYTLP